MHVQLKKKMQAIREKQMVSSLSTKPAQSAMTNSPQLFQSITPVLNMDKHFDVANTQSSLMFSREQEVNALNNGLKHSTSCQDSKQEQSMFRKLQPQLLETPSLSSQLQMNNKLTSPLFSTSQHSSSLVMNNLPPQELGHKEPFTKLFGKEYTAPILCDIIPFDTVKNPHLFISEQYSPISVNNESDQSCNNVYERPFNSELFEFFGCEESSKHFSRDQNIQGIVQRANTLTAESRPFQMNAISLPGQNYHRNVNQVSQQFPSPFHQGFSQTKTGSKFSVAMTTSAYRHSQLNLPGVSSNDDHRGLFKF